MLDIGTYGNSPAATILVEKINKNNIEFKQLGKILASHNTLLNDIGKTNSKFKLTFAILVHNKALNSSEDLPNEVKTYVINLLKAKFRAWKRENYGNYSV